MRCSQAALASVFHGASVGPRTPRVHLLNRREDAALLDHRSPGLGLGSARRRPPGCRRPAAPSASRAEHSEREGASSSDFGRRGLETNKPTRAHTVDTAARFILELDHAVDALGHNERGRKRERDEEEQLAEHCRMRRQEGTWRTAPIVASARPSQTAFQDGLRARCQNRSVWGQVTGGTPTASAHCSLAIARSLRAALCAPAKPTDQRKNNGLWAVGFLHTA